MHRSLLLLALPLVTACASAGGSGDPEAQPQAGAAGAAGQGGAGSGGSAGGSGSAGSDANNAGRAGDAGQGGSAGQAQGGAGNGGAAGKAGNSGEAGQAGDPFGGAAGEAGSAGQAQGGAGNGGAAGQAGGAGGAGQAGAGQAGAPSGTTCATAIQASVAPDQPLKISDTTTSYTNYFGAYCDAKGASGKDTAYKILPKADGPLTITLTANDASFDPVLSVTRAECTVFVTNKDGSCANWSGPGGAESIEIDAIKDEPLWIYVDAEKDHDGAFSLSVEYANQGAAGSGGSGQAGASGQGGAGAAGEAGAGGNGGSAAGSAGSAGAPAPVGQSCSDPVKIQLKAGDTIALDGTTAGAKDNFLGYCNTTNDGPDQLIEVSVQAAGKLNAKLTPNSDSYDVALYAYNGECTSAVLAFDVNNGKGDCSELFGPGVAEAIDPLTVAPGDKVYLYVDSNKKNGTLGGPFTLSLSLE